MIGRYYDLKGMWRYSAWWMEISPEAFVGRYFIFTHPTLTWGVYLDTMTLDQGRAIRGTAEQDTLSAAARAYAVTLGALDP